MSNMVKVFPHLSWVRVYNGPVYTSEPEALADGWQAAQEDAPGCWVPLELEDAEDEDAGGGK